MACLLAGQAAAAVQGPPKAPYRDLPSDRRREHSELAERSPHAYEIEFRGAVDGVMTRMPVGYGAFRQGWQPNRSVRIENVGQTDVRNPRMLVNGKRRWWTVKDIVADATSGTHAPAERARAIWEFCRRHRFHACTWDAECNDALKVLHVYGYTLCGNEAHVINDLWKAAGFETRQGYPIGHCVTEVLYDGAYHLMDSDEHVICLKRDNRTIASCEEVVRDHDLVKRTHTYGILQPEGRKTDEFSASLYVHEGKRAGDRGFSCRHAMELTLRPGESIEFLWDHVGKQYTAGLPVKEGQPRRDGLGDLLAGWGPTAYDNMRNGKVRYRPDLTRATARRGADAVRNAVFDPGSGTIRAAAPQEPASVTWRFASPYVFVGARASASVRLEGKASAQWRFSTDGKTWQAVATLDEPGSGCLRASLDDLVSPRRKPTYTFWLELILRGGAVARDVAFEHDVQTSLLALPELEVGTNRIVYADASAEELKRKVRITHRWLERTTWRPPKAPAGAVSPKDGAAVQGSRVAFRWQPAVDPDGDRIVDYHFELSDRPDLRWPLSPNFEKLVSRTPWKGQPAWTVPLTGLLNPDTPYYWRVRAQDDKGVWGPWSKVFTLQVQAPGVPIGVNLIADGKGGFVLHWRPHPKGRRPAAYKLYGSDEKGFSVSDTEHRVHMGRGFVRDMKEYESIPADSPDAGMVKTPANLIETVRGTSLRVVGADLAGPNANKAYYRVVAVDAAGNESGPSDYAEVPRPFLVVPGENEAKLHTPYRLRPKVIRSLGDLRCRPSGRSSYNAAFWDREEVEIAAEGLPAGLNLNARTGEISGAPTQAGAFTITLTAADKSGKRHSASLRLTVRR
jgi:hypothetical protein